MHKYPIYLQDDEKSCGVYCLKMLLKYYGIDEDTTILKTKTRVDASGTTIKGLVETLKSYNVETKAYKASLDQLEENHVPIPAILHIIEGKLGHFVVLYELGEQCVIGDPAKGLLQVPRMQLKEMYSGFVIVIRHIGRYYDYHDVTYKDFLKQTYKLYRKEVGVLIRYALFSSLLSFVLSRIAGIMIDEMKVKMPLFLGFALFLAYSILSLIKVLLTKMKNKKTVLFERALDKEVVYRSIINTLHLPEHLLSSDAGLIQSKLLNLYHLSSYTVRFYEAFSIDILTIVLLFVALVLLSPIMALLACVSFLVIFFYVRSRSRLLFELYKTTYEKHNIHMSELLEFISSRHLYRQNANGKKWEKRFEHAYEQEANSVEDQEMAKQSFVAQLESLHVIFLTLILFVGFYSFHASRLTLGHLLAFYMLYSLMETPIIELATSIVEYRENVLLFESFKEFGLVQKDGHDDLKQAIATIDFDDVTYGYGYHLDVLKHLDFTINHNLFIMGANGSGKSTLFYLLKGLDDCYKGNIYLNDQELRTLRKASLYKHMAYCARGETLLKGSVRENIGSHDDEAIHEVLQLLESEELYYRLDEKMDMDGQPFSSGEQAIIQIARCLLKESDVCLFDEVFSSIAFSKAKRIIHKIFKAYPDTLFVIVTHQLNLMNKGEEYAIMGDGKVKEIKVKR